MALVLNVDFACGGANERCNPLNDVAAANFNYLKNVLNRFAKPVGFSMLKPNGVLDNATLVAAQKTGRWAISLEIPELTSNMMVRNTAFATGLGQIAADSRQIAMVFDDIANQQMLPIPPPPSSAWVWWVVAGVAALAAGGAVAYTVNKKGRY